MQTRTRSRPRLFVSDRGAGEPVLLITGWTISCAVFDPIAGLYEPHVRVLAYDHRGAGRSQPWPAPVSMAMLAADGARVLDDREIAAAHVVGLSMGAAVALELAIRMAHRVKSLVLVGGGPGGPAARQPSVREGTATLVDVVADTARHRQVWPAAAVFSASFRAAHPDRVAAYMPYFARHRAPPWMSGWQALAAACFNRRSSLQRVSAPTLVLHGELDAMAPSANAHLLADGIPSCELHIVPGAGHAVPLERPEATAELLVGWVRRHAQVVPSPPLHQHLTGELLTRPFALPAGALRNTRDAAAAVARAFRS